MAGFLIFAALMVMRLLPTLLALPLLAAWIAFVAGMPFVSWLNDVLLGGALRLASPIALVIFGAMFARVIQKVGISDAIIKRAAELSGDQPVSIAFLLTAATVFVFSGMSGLGPVIMIGSITLPLMTGVGIPPVDAAALFLLAICTGGMANIAGYGTYIGIFGSVPSPLWLPASILLKIFLPETAERNPCLPESRKSCQAFFHCL